VTFQQTGNKETMFAANAILILRSPDAVAHLENGWNFISTPRSLVDWRNTAEEVFSGVTTGDYRIIPVLISSLKEIRWHPGDRAVTRATFFSGEFIEANLTPIKNMLVQ